MVYMKFHNPQRKIENCIGIIFSIINIFNFLLSYKEAYQEDALYQLAWMPMMIIDFPVSLIFIVLCLFMPVNISAFIAFGLLGTIWWYYLGKKIYIIFVKFKKNSIKNTKITQIFISLTHLAFLIYYYLNILDSSTQSFIDWLLLFVIDFPISVLLVPPNIINTNISYFIFGIFCILSTIWWYFLSGFIMSKLLHGKTHE